ncbi:TolC family protein [bacterium]|nr:TolC family protein [bacterium]
MMEVASKYFNFLESQELYKLRLESLIRKKHDLAFAEAQFELGLVPRSDILKARVEHTSAQLDSIQAKGDLEITQAELNQVMSLPLDTPLSIKPIPLEISGLIDLEANTRLALKERSEIQQQQANTLTRKYNIQLAQINRWPSLSLNGNYSAFMDDYVLGQTEISRENWDLNSSWQVGLNLNVPLFYGGDKTRAVKSAKIDFSNAQLDLLELQQKIELEVKVAYLNLTTSLKKIELTEKQVASAEDNYNSSKGRYETQTAPITEVLDAGVALTSSELNYIRAVYDYLYARAKFNMVTGQPPYEIE